MKALSSSFHQLFYERSCFFSDVLTINATPIKITIVAKTVRYVTGSPRIAHPKRTATMGAINAKVVAIDGVETLSNQKSSAMGITVPINIRNR